MIIRNFFFFISIPSLENDYTQIHTESTQYIYKNMFYTQSLLSIYVLYFLLKKKKTVDVKSSFEARGRF